MNNYIGSLLKILPFLITDVLFLLFVGLSGMLLFEAVLPGFITSKVPFFFLLFPMSILFCVTAFFFPKTKKNSSKNDTHRNWFSYVLFIASCMIFLISLIGSSFRYAIWEICILLASGIVTTFLFLKEESPKEHI